MSAGWISTLTPREAQTVRAVIDTGCNKGAARKLGIAVKTVDFHLHQALRKSGLAFRVRMLIEYDRAYFETACRRIEQAHAQGQLLPPEPTQQANQESLL